MPGMVKLNPDSVLYDANGNPIGVVLDGSVYRLQTEARLATGHGLAIESKQDSMISTLANIEADTEQLDIPLSTRASEATVSGIQVVANSIYSELQQKTEPNDLQKTVLYDASGNMVGVVLDNTLYRLQTDSKIAKGSSNLVHLDAVDTIAGRGRLKATLYTPDGDPVAFGSAPPNPESINNKFALNGVSSSLLVDGSVTPVAFTYPADSTYDISIQEIKLVIASNSITFGTGYFGATAGPLTNGLLVEITANGNNGTVANLTRNECFVHFASPGGFQWIVSNKDLLSSTYLVGGGLKLIAGSNDKVQVTVRDNLSAAGIYFSCIVKGNLLPHS